MTSLAAKAVLLMFYFSCLLCLMFDKKLLTIKIQFHRYYNQQIVSQELQVPIPLIISSTSST